MTRYAIIENNVVKNVAVADAEFAAANGWVEAHDASPGWVLEGGVLVPPPAVLPPPPEEISDRQFAHQLAASQIISQAEALAFVKTGAIPAALQAIVDSIEDDGARFDAEMFISGATIFKRNHPLTLAIGTAYGWTGEQMDDFWRAAAGR